MGLRCRPAHLRGRRQGPSPQRGPALPELFGRRPARHRGARTWDAAEPDAPTPLPLHAGRDRPACGGGRHRSAARHVAADRAVHPDRPPGQYGPARWRGGPADHGRRPPGRGASQPARSPDQVPQIADRAAPSDDGRGPWPLLPPAPEPRLSRALGRLPGHGARRLPLPRATEPVVRRSDPATGPVANRWWPPALPAFPAPHLRRPASGGVARRRAGSVP